mmetsp:Transcript_83882/g.171074  ORF Transcript_83882/g.171074 Transcript_83882/m.171074 type:complete len:284 (+) Transcript_83882:80-931(+)
MAPRNAWYRAPLIPAASIAKWARLSASSSSAKPRTLRHRAARFRPMGSLANCDPKSRECLLCDAFAGACEMQMNTAVMAVPVRLCSSRATRSTRNERLDTRALDRLDRTIARTAVDNIDSEKLVIMPLISSMFPSLTVASPCAAANRSEPARSTNCMRDVRTASSALSYARNVSHTKQCDRELESFIPVAAVFRDAMARNIRCTAAIESSSTSTMPYKRGGCTFLSSATPAHAVQDHVRIACARSLRLFTTMSRFPPASSTALAVRTKLRAPPLSARSFCTAW